MSDHHIKEIKINISGKEWLIKLNYKDRQSSFDSWKRIMVIGCKDRGDIRENIVHECLECILVEHNLRFQQPFKNPDNGDYLFCFNHKEFQNVARDYATVQVELTKISREGE